MVIGVVFGDQPGLEVVDVFCGNVGDLPFFSFSGLGVSGDVAFKGGVGSPSVRAG